MKHWGRQKRKPWQREAEGGRGTPGLGTGQGELCAERGAGSCQGEVKGQGSPCPTEVPGVSHRPGDTLTVLPRFRRPVSPCTALELCREREQCWEGGGLAMPVGSPARPWCHRAACGADPQVQGEAPSRCDIMGRASTEQLSGPRAW